LLSQIDHNESVVDGFHSKKVGNHYLFDERQMQKYEADIRNYISV